MPRYVVRLKWPEPEAVRSLEELEKAMSSGARVVESFLEERSQDTTPTPWTGALPAAGGEEYIIPGRPAEVSHYQSAVGGGLWLVSGSQHAIDSLKDAHGDLVQGVVEDVALELPAPQVELMEGGLAEVGSSYHLKLLGVDSSLHSQTDGSGVSVAIIDSGLYKGHSEFKRTVILKDDSYDYKQQPWKRGSLTYIKHQSGKKVETRHYHGTAVAGMLCGASSGVAPGISVIVHTVFYENVTLWRVEPAMLYSHLAGADIIVMSFGTRGYNSIFEDEIYYLTKKDNRLIVTAIGNDGPGTHGSPGDYQDVLSVGATDVNDQAWLNPETNKGTSGALMSKGNTCYRKPDVYAPGASLTLPVQKGVDSSGYITRSGTSFAAPLVAGVAALVLSWYRQQGKTITATDVREHLLATADDVTLPKELGSSGKRVNAAKAVKCLKTLFPTP